MIYGLTVQDVEQFQRNLQILSIPNYKVMSLYLNMSLSHFSHYIDTQGVQDTCLMR